MSKVFIKPDRNKIPYELKRDWLGKTAFIIGGGPSVKEIFDNGMIEEISKHKVIAVNDSFLLFPKADILYFGDDDWFHDNKADVRDNFDGGEILSRVFVKEEWGEYHYKSIPFNRIARNMAVGLSRHPGAVAGWCSGSNAINVAYLKGATEINLVGFDMKGENWHNRHIRPKKPDCYNLDFLPHLFRMAQELNGEVKVINTCMDSAMEFFEKKPLATVLSELTVHE